MHVTHVCVVLFALATATPAGFFWQLTDVHLNPWYREGADVFATKCNNVTHEANQVRAKKWGDYHCESPYRLVADALDFMRSLPADFVVWTGDDSPMNEKYPLPSPDLHMTQNDVYSIVSNLTHALQAFTVLPSLGNHEVWRPSELPAPDSDHTRRIFATIGETWRKSGMISDADEYARFVSQGQMVLRPTPGLTVVSLNTLWCDLGNLESDAHLLGPVDALVFGFLEQALHNASSRGDAVWITGHVPFIPKNSRQECLDAYYKLAQKYNDTIRAHLFGHTHKDHFLSVNAEMAPILIAPSLTPESWHDIGQNPALRRFAYDPKTFDLLDYEQYFLNLTATNANNAPAWQLEYRAIEAYSLPDLSASSYAHLAQRILQNASLTLDFYQRWRSQRTDMPKLDAKTKKMLSCLLTSKSWVQWELCKIE